MNVGQQVQFTKTAEVVTSIVAHPSGILEITRHTDHHQLQKLFGPAKDINGHSDAEVMLYLLAKETGWLDTFVQRASKARLTEFFADEMSRAVLGETSSSCNESESAKHERMRKEWRLDRHAFIRMPNHDTASPPLYQIGRRPAEKITAEGLLQADERLKSAVSREALGAWQPVVIATDGDETASPMDRVTLVPVVIDDGVARMPREGEKPMGSALVLEKPTLRVTNVAPTAGVSAASATSAAQQAAELKQCAGGFGESLRKKVAMYAKAIGVHAETRDGTDVPLDELINEVFSRVSAGGEAAATNVLPSRQTLLSKWRETDGAPADIVDDVLGTCQRALALWMARENFLRHRFRGMMIEASQLLLQSTPADESSRAQWTAKRDELLESIQWIDSDMGSKSYHPSHDAEEAFEVLHRGLGFRLGIGVLSLHELAKVAIGRLNKLQSPPAETHSTEQPAKTNVQPIPAEQSNGVRPATKQDLVVGGPQRPAWHSGVGTF